MRAARAGSCCMHITSGTMRSQRARRRIPGLVANSGAKSTVGSFNPPTKMRSSRTWIDIPLWDDGCLEGREHTDAAYLGELPWASATDEYPDTWEEVRTHDDSEPIEIKVYPALAEYLWEGSVLDCSINDAVHAYVPAPVLFEAGKLAWVPGTREWKTLAGVSVARYFEEGDSSTLLVREDWLKRTLRETGHSMLFGWLGEKQLIGEIRHYGVVGDWTEINGIASLGGGSWKFGKRRLKSRSRNV